MASRVIDWLALTLPSLYIVHKLLGGWGVAAYVIATAMVIRRPPSFGSLTMYALRRVSLLVGAAVLLAFLVVFPRVDSNQPGIGSDDDEAHDIGVAAILRGDSPYQQQTYLGNPLHQLPGAFILAAPFAMLWTSALQNLFWLAIFFLVVWRETRSLRYTVQQQCLILALSPAVLHGVVTGTGHVSNAIYVTLGLWLMTRAARHWLAAAALGIALASRPNFLFLIPLAWGWLRQHRGLRSANTEIAMVCATVGALVFPFISSDVDGFGPLQTVDRLTRFDSVVPYAGVSIGALMLIAAIALAMRSLTTASLFRRAATVQAIPVAIGLLLGLIGTRSVDLVFATYATFASWPWFISRALAPAHERDRDI